MVHFPIALLLLGSGAALLYLWGVPRSDLRVLAWWPLRLGWIAAAIAVLTGLVDQSGLPPRPPYARVLNGHIAAGMALLVVYGFLLYRQWLWMVHAQRRNAAESAARDLLDHAAARSWITVLLVLGIVLVVGGGWLGGQLVYSWGVNVTP
jgi:uncharacterized membrane protein